MRKVMMGAAISMGLMAAPAQADNIVEVAQAPHYAVRRAPKWLWCVVIVVLPIIAPSLIGVALFGFTLSYDELARSSQAIGDVNTLPLELQGLTTTVTTPEIYALGTVTTAVSALVIGTALGLTLWLQKRRARRALAGLPSGSRPMARAAASQPPKYTGGRPSSMDTSAR